jgi:hypothetical protein
LYFIIVVCLERLSWQLRVHQKQELVSDGLVESQRPCVAEAEVQKNRCDLKVASRQVQHANIVLVQDYDTNLDLEWLAS